MRIEINEQERDMLIDLVESRIGELHPTIRRSRVSECTESLKQDLKTLERLLEHLKQTTAGPVA